MGRWLTMSPGAVDPTADPGPDPAQVRSVRRWRTVGVVAILAMALFWLWIFSGAAKKENPDRVQDREWVERAEATCASTMRRIDRRSQNAGKEDRGTRADAIDESTGELHRMLGHLDDPPPANAGDREVVDPWLSDWEKLLADRDRYADAIRRNPDARFLTTEKFGDSLDEVVATFAEINDMPSCAPAGDVG